MSHVVHLATSSCPHCLAGFHLAVQAPAVELAPGRVLICPVCSGFMVITQQFGVRRPTGPERVRIEASGLGQSLREDVRRIQTLLNTGVLPPKEWLKSEPGDFVLGGGGCTPAPDELPRGAPGPWPGWDPRPRLWPVILTGLVLITVVLVVSLVRLGQ